MPKEKRIIYVTAIIAALLALYCYNPFVLFFQSDDFVHIPLSAAGELLQQNSFRPVCDISVMLDYRLWGQMAWGYHLTNLLLHLLASFIFFRLLKLLFKKYTIFKDVSLVCWLSAALFFVYAMHSEAVLWILGRSAVLGAVFSLLFLYCYLRRNESVIFVAGFVLCWVLCLLTYESTWVLPVFCFFISAAAVKENKSLRRKELWHTAVVIITFLIFLVVRDHYIQQVTGTYESGFLLNGDYALLLKHYALLLTRCFVPAFIDNKIIVTIFIVITLVLLWFFITTQKNRALIIVIFLCFFVSLLPYISLGVDTNGTESERFLYLPEMIVVLLLALIIKTAASTQKWIYWLYPALFIIHLFILFQVKDNYVIAGSINRQIATALKNTGNQKVVYAADVPQAQNGAFILRQGLPQMMHWLSGKSPDTVITCSQRYELLPLQYPYKIIYSDTLSLKYNGNMIYPGKDTLLLKFTGAALFISK